MDIDPKLLRMFTTVLHCGSVTRAAVLLNTSQPTISKGIKRLEGVVGFTLFETSGRGMRPTAEAQMLHEDALRAERELETVRHRIQQIRQGRKRGLRIASIPALVTSVIPRTILAFHDVSPKTPVSVEMWRRDRILAEVGAGRVDIGVIYSLSPDVPPGFKVLAYAPMRCIMPADHPLTGKKTIRIEDLRSEKLVIYHHVMDFVDILWRLLEQNGLTANVVVEGSQGAFLRDMVHYGVGLSVIDGFTARDAESRGLASRPFEPELPFYLAVTDQRSDATVDSRAFRDALEKQVSEFSLAVGNSAR